MALRQNIGFILLLLLCFVQSEVNENGSGDDHLSKAAFNSMDDVVMINVEHSNSKECPYVDCQELSASCITCDFNDTCVYGSTLNVTCHSKVNCVGDKTFLKSMKCRYCYQTEHWEHSCVQMANCSSSSSPRNHYRTNCTVKGEILCLGRRTFLKNIPCNWTGGYRWSTALLLSITLGGFGADRFYLGQWQEGIGKLFSFGGLGVWTLIDVILIAIRYLGPSDGSLYL